MKIKKISALKLPIKKASKKYTDSLTPGAIVAAGVALAVGFIAVSEAEKDELTYARYEIDGKGKVSDNVRLVFLSDLHEKSFGGNNERLKEMIDNADPDIVLIGGDMIKASKDRGKPDKREVTLDLCSYLGSKYPTYYGNGNHEQRLEYDYFSDRLKDYGVSYLSNETVDAPYNISVTGLNIAEDYYRKVIPGKMNAGYIKSSVGEFSKDKFNILLAHSPLFLEAYAESGADLVLSGHFHGGTIRLPGDIGLMTPQYQFFNENVVGLKESKDTVMIISGGLGTHSINIRINNKPQVVVVDIKA